MKHGRKEGPSLPIFQLLTFGLLVISPLVSRNKNPVHVGLDQEGFVDWYRKVEGFSLQAWLDPGASMWLSALGSTFSLWWLHSQAGVSPVGGKDGYGLASRKGERSFSSMCLRANLMKGFSLSLSHIWTSPWIQRMLCDGWFILDHMPTPVSGGEGHRGCQSLRPQEWGLGFSLQRKGCLQRRPTP